MAWQARLCEPFISVSPARVFQELKKRKVEGEKKIKKEIK